MDFQCSVCKYRTNSKQHIKRHISTKKKNICSNAEINEIEVEIKCEHCNKFYTTKRSLYQHQKLSCKVIKTNRESELEAKVAELEVKLEAERDKPKTVVNIQNNFIVNGYRKTSFEHLTDRQYQKAVRRMLYSVPQMIQDVHFDPEVPENHNIFISNIKGKYAMVYDGEKWCSKPQDQVIDQLINDQEYAIEDWLGEGDNFPKEMAKFNEYLEKKELHDEVKEIIREEVKLLLYNNRGKIKRIAPRFVNTQKSF